MLLEHGCHAAIQEGPVPSKEDLTWRRYGRSVNPVSQFDRSVDDAGRQYECEPFKPWKQFDQGVACIVELENSNGALVDALVLLEKSIKSRPVTKSVKWRKQICISKIVGLDEPLEL